jgi:hypothetical protein
VSASVAVPELANMVANAAPDGAGAMSPDVADAIRDTADESTDAPGRLSQKSDLETYTFTGNCVRIV